MTGAPDGTNGWSAEWGGTRWRVELRELPDDYGSSLRLGRSDGSLEWLRFDCLEREPHWHLDPEGRDEIHPLEDVDDPIGECFARLRRELASLLERAGADPEAARAAARGLDDAEGRRFLRAAERAMRHRPAVLEDLSVQRLLRRRSEKWHTHPPDVLPVWVAEMDFPVAAPIQATLDRFNASSDYGYPVDLRHTGLAEAFCERMEERFDWNVEPTRVEFLSDVVQGLHLALLAYAETGEGAVVQTPIYPPFLGAVRATGRRLVENRMVVGSERLEIDFDGLTRGIDSGTRLLLLCNPHNPSGRVFARDELERLAALARHHDLVVVSDEIHGDLVLDGQRHVPFASLDPETARRTVTLTSPSKAFNIPGLRCAVAHFGSEDLQRRFRAVVPRSVRGGIGLLGIHASIAAWRWGQPWLDEVVCQLERNRERVRTRLAARVPEIRTFALEGTYLAWLDFRALEIEGSPATRLLDRGRVALSDGRLFGPGWEGFARLNLATSSAILTDATDRIAKALGR